MTGVQTCALPISLPPSLGKEVASGRCKTNQCSHCSELLPNPHHPVPVEGRGEPGALQALRDFSGHVAAAGEFVGRAGVMKLGTIEEL